MKKNQLLFCVVFLAVAAIAFAEVTTIRELPKTGEHTTKGEKRPYPTDVPGTTTPGSSTDLSGKLVVGGLAGSDETGELVYDLVTDSEVVFTQGFAGGGSFGITANAVRENSFGELDGEYGMTSSLDLPKFGLELEGSLFDTTKETREQAVALGAGISLRLIETLPILFGYSYTTTTETENELSIVDQWGQIASFAATGDIGKLALTALTDYTSASDAIRRFESYGVIGKLGVGIPIGDSFRIGVSAAPSFSGTSYLDTGNKTSTTTLESALDLTAMPGEWVNIALTAGRTDEWATDTQLLVPTESHSSSWIGELLFDLLAPSGFLASAGYSLATFPATDTSHTFDAKLGFQPDETGFLVSAETTGTVDVSSPAQWNAAAALAPTEGMRITGAYTGGLDWSAEPNQLLTSGTLEYSHEPIETFAYGLSGAIAETKAGDITHLEAEAAIQMNMQPWRVFTLYLGETVGIVRDDPATADSTVSVAETGLKIPIGRAVALRYDFAWDRLLATTITDTFRHRGGITITPEAVPIEFSTEYSLVAGGALTHEILSSLSLLFSGGFGIQSGFSMRIFDNEAGEPVYPFDFTLQGSFAF